MISIKIKPVSVNNCYGWRVVRRGRYSVCMRYPKPEIVNFRKAFRLHLNVAQKIMRAPLACACEVEVHFFARRTPDVDNCVKPFLDALQGVCYKNDNQVRRLIVEVHKGEPRIEFEVREVFNGQATNRKDRK